MDDFDRYRDITIEREMSFFVHAAGNCYPATLYGNASSVLGEPSLEAQALLKAYDDKYGKPE